MGNNPVAHILVDNLLRLVLQHKEKNRSELFFQNWCKQCHTRCTRRKQLHPENRKKCIFCLELFAHNSANHKVQMLHFEAARFPQYPSAKKAPFNTAVKRGAVLKAPLKKRPQGHVICKLCEDHVSTTLEWTISCRFSVLSCIRISSIKGWQWDSIPSYPLDSSPLTCSWFFGKSHKVQMLHIYFNRLGSQNIHQRRRPFEIAVKRGAVQKHP